jgi:raffinose/stachyose/melibiose transport system permease protein
LPDSTALPGTTAAHTRRGSGGVSVAFVAPALVALALVVVAPSIAGAVLTFTDYSGFGQFQWIGLDNYRRFFSDPQSTQAIVNTVLLAVAVVLGQNICGLALALGLERRFTGRSVLRVLFLMPAILSPVIISYLWQYIYAPTGALNVALGSVGLTDLQRSWLGDSQTALWAVAVAVVWQHTGYAMVIYLAGLHGVPRELTEASWLDGANAWQQFTRIKLPLLAPAVTINLVLSLITGLRLFDQIIAMTGGGPGYATETIATAIYERGFGSGELAYGLTMSIMLAAAIAVISAVQVRVLRRREELMQ